jgi:hypothetical protein
MAAARLNVTELWLSKCRLQWPLCLRNELSSPAAMLEVVGSNPARDVDVYMRLFNVCVVLCVGRGLSAG